MRVLDLFAGIGGISVVPQVVAAVARAILEASNAAPR